jgi:MFS family permease
MSITIPVLFGGLALLLVGIGLLGTLLGVRATLEGFTNIETGFIMTGYYGGYIIGTHFGPELIRSVGHIRVFSTFAALAAASTLAFGLVTESWIWFGLRILNGVSVVCLYMVVESWLNEQTPNEMRGRVFSLYMITTLAALAGGQYLLLIYDPANIESFVLAAILIVLGLVPIAVMRITEPKIETFEYMALKRLFELSPLSTVGAFATGLVNGIFWGMTAVFAARLGLDDGAIALLMSMTILGGVVLQLPIGHLSDRHDRRNVLILVGVAAAAAAAGVGWLVLKELPGLALLAFLYGGLMFPLYAICVAHANDHVQACQVLGTTRGLLLLYGIGAFLGPFGGGLVMAWAGPVGLPVLSAVILLSMSLYGFYRKARRAPPPLEEQTEFVPVTRTTPVMLEMHPQAEEDIPQDSISPTDSS